MKKIKDQSSQSQILKTVKDLSIDTQTGKNLRHNNPLLPKSIRASIIGKSGCGKTNLLMNLLLDSFGTFDWLDYNHLTIYSRSLHQAEYILLKTCFLLNNSKSDVLKCIKDKINPERKHLLNSNTVSNTPIKIETFENDTDIKDPTEFDIKSKNLIIFDDVMLEKQKKIESFYTRGRHNNIDCIYIAQNYITLPRHTIRENTNLFILFKQDAKSINNFYQDHCTDITLEEFKYLCSETWKERYSFIVVDMDRAVDEGKYRRGLTEFYFPESVFI